MWGFAGVFRVRLNERLLAEIGRFVADLDVVVEMHFFAVSHVAPRVRLSGGTHAPVRKGPGGSPRDCAGERGRRG